VGPLQAFNVECSKYTKDQLGQSIKVLGGERNTIATIMKKNIYWEHVWNKSSKALKFLRKNDKWLFYHVI